MHFSYAKPIAVSQRLDAAPSLTICIRSVFILIKNCHSVIRSFVRSLSHSNQTMSGFPEDFQYSLIRVNIDNALNFF